MDGTVIEVSRCTPETHAASCSALRLPLDDAAVQEAARRSRGNPLFALQQLHAWALAGNMELRRRHVPRAARRARRRARRPPRSSGTAASLAMPEQHRARGRTRPRRSAATSAATCCTRCSTSLGRPADAAIAEPAERGNPDPARRRAATPGRTRCCRSTCSRSSRERADKERIFARRGRGSAQHPLANTRRIVRQRVVNLIHAGEPDPAALPAVRLPAAQLERRARAARHARRSRAAEGPASAGARWRSSTAGRPKRCATSAARRRPARCAEMARDPLRGARRPGKPRALPALARPPRERAGQHRGRAGARRSARSRPSRSCGNALGQAQCEAVAGEIEYLLGNYEQARDSPSSRASATSPRSISRSGAGSACCCSAGSITPRAPPSARAA